MIDHLPALQIVVPFVAAPICVLLRRVALVRAFAILVSWMVLGMSLKLLTLVTDQGTISYALGGWTPPIGIEYRVDLLNAYVLVIVATIGAVVLPFGLGRGEVRMSEKHHHLFYAAFLLCLTGLMGITITGDAFNVFVFLEISSLSAYTLIALGRERRALMAAYSYLIMGTVGGTFILIGIGLVYQMTGSLNMADMASRLPAVMETRTVWMGFAFLAVGTSIKLAVFPLHQWLPNAYSYAPAAISAFLAATATKVSYYVFVRVIYTLFGAAFVFGTLKLHMVLVPFSLMAMFIGSLAAVYQKDIKRLLAYSSVAQIGYMTLGLSFNNVEGLTGGLVHLFNHALMKGGLFLVVACVAYRTGSSLVSDLRGLGRKMPLTMAAFVIGGLSLIGVPGTVGFISKWYLVLGALERGWPIVAVLILLSSLVAVVYVWRVVEVIFFQEREDDSGIEEVPLQLLVPTWILIGGTVVFGFATNLTAGTATAAAQYLLAGGP